MSKCLFFMELLTIGNPRAWLWRNHAPRVVPRISPNTRANMLVISSDRHATTYFEWCWAGIWYCKHIGRDPLFQLFTHFIHGVLPFVFCLQLLRSIYTVCFIFWFIFILLRCPGGALLCRSRQGSRFNAHYVFC